MGYASSRSGFIAHPHAIQSGVLSSARALNRVVREAKKTGEVAETKCVGVSVRYDPTAEKFGYEVAGEKKLFVRQAQDALIDIKARQFNAKHKARFDALVAAAGGVWDEQREHWTIPTRFGEARAGFYDASTWAFLNFQTYDKALLEGASRTTGSSAMNGKLGFFTDAETEIVIDAFERTLKAVSIQ